MRINPDIAMRAQGAYYFLTGIWPLVHLESFLAVTGPKEDIWLVNTMGLLFMAIGSSLLFRPVAILSLSSATSLIFIDIFYTAADHISPVYLGDAAMQGLLFVWIMAGLISGRSGRQDQEGEFRQ